MVPLPLSVRILFFTTLVVTAVFGVLLFVIPGATNVYWPWVITTDHSAYLIGSVYLAAGVTFAIALRQNDWSLARNGAGGTIVFSLVLLAATTLHWDQFRSYHPVTLVWLALYYAPPLVYPVAYRFMRRQPLRPEPGAVLGRRWRIWIVGRGLVYVVLAGAGFVFSAQLVETWPWPPGLLDLRVFLAQPALVAWSSFAALRDQFRWPEQQLGFILVGGTGLAQLVGITLGSRDYAWASPSGVALPLMFAEWTATSAFLLWRYRVRFT